MGVKSFSAVVCHCGATATLRSNSLLYNGKEYGNGKAYICDRFPECRGSVGTHPDGKPLGTIPDDETKKLRMEVHALVDPLWREQGHPRGQVYGYLGRLMKMHRKDCHIGMFSKDNCLTAIERIKENPLSSTPTSKKPPLTRRNLK